MSWPSVSARGFAARPSGRSASGAAPSRVPGAHRLPERVHDRHAGQVEIDPQDLRIDIIEPTRDRHWAVRITYLPTGTTVTVDDHPSQLANRDRALELLRDALDD